MMWGWDGYSWWLWLLMSAGMVAFWALMIWTAAAIIRHDRRNVTDIDDNLLIQPQRDGTSWRSLATREMYRFEADMAALGVVRPTYEPRSRDYIDEVIKVTWELLARGAAYERNGSVYFRGADVPSRAGLDRAEAIELAPEPGGHPDDPDK